MMTRIRMVYLGSALAALALAGGGYLAYRRHMAQPSVQVHLRTWHDGPRRAAELLIERYGPPDEIGPGLAAWRDRWPWTRVAVHGTSPDSFLEHAVDYQASAPGAEAIAVFGHGVSYDAAAGRLSARSNSEALNILALNLADEVAYRKRDPLSARDFFVSTARLAAAGRSSTYLERLQFASWPAPGRNPP